MHQSLQLKQFILQEGPVVDEIKLLFEDAATVLDGSVRNYELQYNAYRRLISETDTVIETVINQISGNISMSL
jgi:YD repeat-containing protein